MINPVYVGAFSPDRDYLWVTWSLLTACNYTCRYCCVKGKEISDKETDKNVIKFLHAAPQKEKEVTLFGGEPSIHPRVLNIAKELSSFAKVHIFTNLSMMRRMIQNLVNMNVQFCISYHPDIIEPEPFLRNLNYLVDINGKIDFVNVMMVSEYGERENTVCEYLRKKKIRHRLLPIWREGGGSDWVKSVVYSKRDDVIAIRDTHIIDENGKEYVFSEQECIYLGKDHFTGWKCAAGMRSLFIDHKGIVYRCQADMKSHIIFCDCKDEYPVLEYYRCPHSTCTCEYYIPKVIR